MKVKKSKELKKLDKEADLAWKHWNDLSKMRDTVKAKEYAGEFAKFIGKYYEVNLSSKMDNTDHDYVKVTHIEGLSIRGIEISLFDNKISHVDLDRELFDLMYEKKNIKSISKELFNKYLKEAIDIASSNL